MEHSVTAHLLYSWQGAAVVWSLEYRGPLCVLQPRLQPDGTIPVLPLPGAFILGQLLHLLKPQFPHLGDGDNDRLWVFLLW